MREGAEREPYLWATVPSGNVGVSVDGLGLGVVGVEEANELRGTHFSGGSTKKKNEANPRERLLGNEDGI